MIKSYNRAVFNSDDAGIQSPVGDESVPVGEVIEPVVEVEVTPEDDLQADMEDLFEDTIIKEEGTDEVEVVPPTVEVEPVVIPEVGEPVVEPLSELDELKAANAALLEQINTLAGTPPAPAATEPVEPVEPEVEPTKIDPTNLTELFKDKDVSDLFDTKEGFIGFMQEVANHVQAQTLNQFQQLAPGMVSNTIQSQNSLAEVRDAFYTDNSDLKPVSQYVGKVASNLSAVNPTWTVQQVLTQAALDTRAALNIKQVVVEATPPPKGTPALPGATSVGKGKPTPTNSLADEMEDLFSDI